MIQNKTHDQLVAEAHVTGRCGQGTRDDPIQDCSLMETVANALQQFGG